jgi:hypothetical protein
MSISYGCPPLLFFRGGNGHAPCPVHEAGRIGHARYAYFIAKFANSECLAVAQALGVIKQLSDIPVLGRLLEDSDESVRWAASQSLTLIRGEGVVDTVPE